MNLTPLSLRGQKALEQNYQNFRVRSHSGFKEREVTATVQTLPSSDETAAGTTSINYFLPSKEEKQIFQLASTHTDSYMLNM